MGVGSLRRVRTQQFFVPYNGKIADITEADTNKHYLTLANSAGTGAIAGETRKIIAVSVRVDRAAGTGMLNFFPKEGVNSSGQTLNFMYSPIIIADGTQRLQYSQTVANDDFDLYCLGYVVES